MMLVLWFVLLLISISPIVLQQKDKQLIISSQYFMLFFILVVFAYAFYQHKNINYTWQFLDFNSIQLTLSLQFDMLTKIMMCFILVIGFFIYRYAQNYLESDQTRIRFLSQFNLVLCSVLLLVMAANLLTAFVAWQLIGINLYLLLNHYHSDPAANRAAKKKFVINRLGDSSFLLAMILAYHSNSAASFASIHHSPHAELICLLVFISVMTKCAQFPFHIWLIDTMETPTPVSALMHAGVINAGGILLTRISPSLIYFHLLTGFILFIGLISAFLSIQWLNKQPDTKKKLAYSTMGQMGYMLTQCSLGAFPAAIFHLMSHGFYKASLFLNAGETLNQKQYDEKSITYMILIKSFIITAIIFTAGLTLFCGKNQHIPLLMYGFIFLTLLTLTVKTDAQAQRQWHEKIVLYGVITLLFISYLYCFHLFSALLSNYDYAHIIPVFVQIILLLALFIAQIYLWLKPTNTNTPSFTDHTERFFRRYLLSPLRSAGNIIHEPRFRNIIPAIYVALMFFVLISFFYGIQDHRTISIQHANISQWLIFSFLAIALLALVAANRCLSIKSLIIYLVLFELAFTNLAWFDGGTQMAKIGFFHLINISTVLIMLGLLANKKRAKQVPLKQHSNTSSARVFYLMFSLLLLIGIPGTASFISEFYLLNALISDNPLLVIMYIGVIILVAIVIMHSLQLYVFNKNYATVLSTPISPQHHRIFLAVIMLNIVCGLDPSFLLSHL